MNEFLIAIHRDLTSKHPSPSPEQMKEAKSEWLFRPDTARQWDAFDSNKGIPSLFSAPMDKTITNKSKGYDTRRNLCA